MELHLLCFHHEVNGPAGRQVEVGSRRGGDVRGKSGASVGLAGPSDPDDGSVNVDFGDGHGNDVARASVW